MGNPERPNILNWTDPRYRLCMSRLPTSEEFEALGLRVGTVVRAEVNDGARDPAYRLWIDLGSREPVQSSARITDRYEANALVGRQVVVVTGLAPMRVGRFRSDVLVLGALTDDGVVLLAPGESVPPGSIIA